jgi:adenosylcobinamide-GDP ribazoletransferase
VTGVREQLRAFFTALMFLTRIPCPRWVGYEPELLARSTVYFPAVGVIVGLWGAALYGAASFGWTPLVAAALSTAGTAWLTGAFHEDALADACDGFGGGQDTARILTIMKDSRVGAYGVVGLGLALLTKVAALASLDVGVAGRALVAGHVLGRWSSLPLIWGYAYVRDTEGKSKPFAASVTAPRLVLGSVAAAGAVAVAFQGRAGLIAGALVSAGAITGVAGRYFRRQIGGITGDCLGAANQVVELATYLVVAWQWRGAGAAP